MVSISLVLLVLTLSQPAAAFCNSFKSPSKQNSPCFIKTASTQSFDTYYNYYHEGIPNDGKKRSQKKRNRICEKRSFVLCSSSSSTMETQDTFSRPRGSKGKILILGGSGFLGQAVARRAVIEGYSVTSISRRGKPSESEEEKVVGIEYVTGDARDKEVIKSVLSQGEPFTAVMHCIGLLFDDSSGLGTFNRLVSGSGSVPEKESTYDDITRLTAYNAIEAAEEHVKEIGDENNNNKPLPFIFTSAAEAGWPDVKGGEFVEKVLAPDWLKRYLKAKRSVESRLMQNNDPLGDGNALLRPIILRPSLIYSLDRLASLPPVGAFYVGNKIGLPFVDRPVTVQALAVAAVRALGDDSVVGVQRYKEIDALNS